MNILSLFDGMSCGRIALDRAGIKVNKYFASEIDKYAIKVSKNNYPDIIHIGDVFSNKEYFDNEHSKFKQEMLSLGYMQEDCMLVRKDKKQAESRGRIIEYLNSLKES